MVCWVFVMVFLCFHRIFLGVHIGAAGSGNSNSACTMKDHGQQEFVSNQ